MPYTRLDVVQACSSISQDRAPNDAVYFVQAGGARGPIKIGCTCRLRSRLTAIRHAHRARALDDFAELLLSDEGHEQAIHAWRTETDSTVRKRLWTFVRCAGSADVRRAARHDSECWATLHKMLFRHEPLLDMELLKTMPGYEGEEQLLHEEFRANRLDVRDTMRLHLPHFEWFWPSPRLADYIADLNTPEARAST